MKQFWILSLMSAFVFLNFQNLAFAQFENFEGTEIIYEEASPEGSIRPVRTWIVSNPKGAPVAVGATIPAQALENLPDHMVEASVNFPSQKNVPFRHFYLLWEPHGHEPPGVYDIPHLDAHFYLTSKSEREKITCQGADQANCMKQPPSMAIPSDYAPTPAGVAKMGWHWIDTLSPEFHGQTFTKTMVYGYYKGELTFIEPMITTAYLASHPSAVSPIRQPSLYPKPGYYPTGYQISYSAPKDAFDIALINLVYRD